MYVYTYVTSVNKPLSTDLGTNSSLVQVVLPTAAVLLLMLWRPANVWQCDTWAQMMSQHSDIPSTPTAHQVRLSCLAAAFSDQGDSRTYICTPDHLLNVQACVFTFQIFVRAYQILNNFHTIIIHTFHTVISGK